MRTERLARNMRRVTLAFDVTDNGIVTDGRAIWRAALSMLLCESLARAGRVFEVWTIDSTGNPFKATVTARRTDLVWMGSQRIRRPTGR